MYLVVEELPENLRRLPEARLNLLVNDIKNMVSGNIVSSVSGEIDIHLHAAADRYRELQNISSAALAVVVLALAIGGASIGFFDCSRPASPIPPQTTNEQTDYID